MNSGRTVKLLSLSIAAIVIGGLFSLSVSTPARHLTEIGTVGPASTGGAGSDSLAKQSTQAIESPPASGQLEILSETTLKLGTLAQGVDGRNLFRIRNAGPGNLVIRLLEKSCGCLSVKVNGTGLRAPLTQPLPPLPLQPIPDKVPPPAASPFSGLVRRTPPDQIHSGANLPMSAFAGARPAPKNAAPEPMESMAGPQSDSFSIPPGQMAGIEVAVNTKSVRGRIHHRVLLGTSDASHASIELGLEGDVYPKIELSRAWLNFGTVRFDTPGHLAFQVTSRTSSDLQIKHTLSSDPEITVRTERMTQAALEETGLKAGFQVHLQTSDTAPIGRIQGEVTLVTNQPDQPLIVLPLSGNVEGDLKLMQNGTLEFGRFLQSAGATQGVYGKIPAAKPMDIRVAKFEPEFLKVTLHTPQDLSDGNQFFIVEATAPVTAPLGEFSGQIELETNPPSATRVRIRVHGIISDLPQADPGSQ